MKRTLALLLATAFILTACGANSGQDTPSNPFGELDFEDAPTNKTDGSDNKPEKSEIVWGDTESELAREFYALTDEELEAKMHEDSQRYKEILGIESGKDFSTMRYSFSGDYFLTNYCIANLRVIGYVIDTNLEEPGFIEIVITEINPNTGEEKVISNSANGDIGAHLTVFADDGFIIKAYTIVTDFSTETEKIDQERTDEQLEDELFLEMLEGLTPEEQDALLEERYQQLLQEWAGSENGQ